MRHDSLARRPTGLNQLVAVATLTVLAAGCATAPVGHEPAPAGGVEVHVLDAPSPLVGGGAVHLAYELILTNRGPGDVAVEELIVLADDHPFARFGPSDLAQRWRLLRPLPPSDGSAAPAPGVIPSDGWAVIYLWMAAGAPEALPDRLTHALTLRSGDGALTTVAPAPLVVDRAELPRVFGPPVDGGGWVVANAPSNESPHRRSVQRVDGVWHLSQRYAVDLVRVLGPEGTHIGDPLDNASYHAYGVEALAIGAGTVVAIKDGIPENVPGRDSRAVAITPETLGGNLVILDLGGELYAVYAHFQPGSLRVAVGDAVAAGDPLGLIGNSGNSTEPHLHLHVCDAPEVIRCMGRPWAIDRFVEIPLDLSDPAEPRVGPPTPRGRSLPVSLGVLIFGDAEPPSPNPPPEEAP